MLNAFFLSRDHHEKDYMVRPQPAAVLTPVIVAVIHRDEDMIRLLMTHDKTKADVNLADQEGMTPLMHAVKTNDIR